MRVLLCLLLAISPASAQVVAPSGDRLIAPSVPASPGIHPEKPRPKTPVPPKPVSPTPIPPKPAAPKAVSAKPATAKPAAAKPAVAQPVAPVAPVAPTAPAAPPAKPDPAKGSSTGLPLPRWAAFRSDEVNLRSGPGTQYPIDWIYHRRDFPVRIEREYEVWRLVETQDGTKGWVHQATLTGRRGFVVAEAERVLRTSADDTAAAVARLQPGVVGHIRSCEAAKPWCEVQTGDYRGFVRRTDIFGVSPDEPIN